MVARSGGTISDKDARKEIERIVRKAQAAADNKQVPVFTALEAEVNTMLGKIKNETRLQKALKRRNYLLNKRARETSTGRIKQFLESGDKIATAMMKFLVGEAGQEAGERASLQGFVNGRVSAARAALKADLEQDPRLLDLFMKGEMADDIMLEVGYMRQGKGNVSGNKDAFAIAQVVVKHYDQLNAEGNRWGAYRATREDYVMKNMHDGDRILDAGGKVRSLANKEKAYQAWREEILLRADPKMFEDYLDADEFLRDMFDGITSGVHGRLPEAMQDAVKVGGGPLYKRVSKRRIINFKSVEDEIAYMKKYGKRQDYGAAVFQDIENMAREAELMHQLGPDPAKSFDSMVKWLHGYARSNSDNANADIDAMKFFTSNAQSTFDHITGLANVPENVTTARVVGNLKMVKAVGGLQKVIVSALSDNPIMMFQAGNMGVSGLDLVSRQLQGWHGAIKRIAGDRAAERFATRLGLVSESFSGELINIVETGNRTGGILRKMLEFTMKWQGMNLYDFVNRSAFVGALNSDIASQAAKRFSDIDAYTARAFKIHEIGEVEWDVLRGLTENYEGRNYIFNDRVYGADIEVFRPVVEAKGQKVTPSSLAMAKDDVYSKWVGFMKDEVDSAILRPGAKEIGISTFHGRPGSMAHTAGGLLMMYKNFALAMYNKALKRAWQFGMDGGGIRESAGMRTIGIVSALTASGYVAMSVRDLLDGRTPRRLFDEEGFHSDVLLAAMERGGGVGYWGEFLFSALEKNYQNPMTSMLGPVVSEVGDILSLGGQAVRGENIRPGLRKLVTRNAPFVKMAPFAPAANYLFMNDIISGIDPEYFPRMERQAIKVNHQDFILSPTEMMDYTPYGALKDSLE
jgi:hypothetical protein